jgi:hypothetical protein
MDIDPWDFGRRRTGEWQGPQPERVEQLYYAEDYGIFFLTGQCQRATGRRTEISVRPLHTLAPGTAERMKTQALAWTSARDHEVSITVGAEKLVLRDRATQSETEFSVAGLDGEIARRLLQGGSKAWDKYIEAAERDGQPAPGRRPAPLQL